MRIAVWHNLPSGGGKRALYSHVAGLVQRGHHVEAWCPETADDKYLPLSELIPEHRLPFTCPPEPCGPAAKFKARLRGQPLLHEMNHHSQACAAAISRGGFDLVFAAPCRFYMVPRLGHFLRGRGLPLCLYLQEPNRILYEAMPELPWIALPRTARSRWLPRRWLGLAANLWSLEGLRTVARRELEDARCFDRILVNSYFSRESVIRVYGLDARVCYLGYDATVFKQLEPPPPRERFVIGLGSMNRIKGVATAIEAVACLPLPRPPLVWVANSEVADYRREMEALARQRQVDFRVRNRIDDGALVDLLNRAGLLLYTSNLEPFGYAPVEANACGTPVVAVAEGGIRETVVDGVNGFLCDREPALLGAAMAKLLDDPTLASALGMAGARIATTQWSPQQSITRLEDHLTRLLETSPKA